MAGITINGATVPFTFETVTVDSTAGGVALTAATYATATVINMVALKNTAVEAFISVETAGMRWTVDGTAPTTTVGHLVGAGDTIFLQGFDAIRKFRAIRTTGSSATIQVTYFKN